MLHKIIHILLFSTVFGISSFTFSQINLSKEIPLSQNNICKDIEEPVMPEENNFIEFEQTADNELETLCYSEEEYLLLAKLIDCEASDICTDEHKLWVGQVVLNRVLDDRFPSTLEEVIYQKNPIQYACAYNGAIENNIPSERSKEAAWKLLNGARVCSEQIIWQSEFAQGEQIKIFDVYVNDRLYSTTYFCK